MQLRRLFDLTQGEPEERVSKGLLVPGSLVYTIYNENKNAPLPERAMLYLSAPFFDIGVKLNLPLIAYLVYDLSQHTP